MEDWPLRIFSQNYLKARYLSHLNYLSYLRPNLRPNLLIKNKYLNWRQFAFQFTKKSFLLVAVLAFLLL